jgi:hypothetical protein
MGKHAQNKDNKKAASHIAAPLKTARKSGLSFLTFLYDIK